MYKIERPKEVNVGDFVIAASPYHHFIVGGEVISIGEASKKTFEVEIKSLNTEGMPVKDLIGVEKVNNSPYKIGERHWFTIKELFVVTLD